MVVQWLRLCVSTAGAWGSLLAVSRWRQKNFQKNRQKRSDHSHSTAHTINLLLMGLRHLNPIVFFLYSSNFLLQSISYFPLFPILFFLF